MKAVATQSSSESAAVRQHGGKHIHPELSQPFTEVRSALDTFGVLRKSSCACGGGCPTCEANQQSEMEELRRKGDPASNIVGPEGGPLPAGLGEYVRSSGATGRPLEATTRGDLERSFGHSLDGLRVVTDDAAARAAESLRARAFTLGDSIWFGRGEYRPDTSEGRHLIAHEVAHSLQDAPHRGRVAADLVIGRSDDPAEREADAAADAAARGERVSLSSAGAATAVRPLRMQRICTVTSTPRPDQRIVRCPDGDYQVTLTTTTEPSRPETQIWTDAGWNNSVIWLQLGVCRGGTSVTVTPTVDLPRAVIQILGNVLTGSGALSGVTITPGLQIQILQSNTFTLTLTPAVTLDPNSRDPVTGVGGGVTVQTPDVTVGGQVTVDPRTGSTFFSLTLSGGSTPRRVDCSRGPRPRLVFECRLITHIPGVPEVPELTEPEYQDRYLFFNYAQDTIATDFQSRPTRRGRTPAVDLRERIQTPTDIQALHDEGYRITSIEGFTSPEGTRAASPGFEGNIELARRRARAALTFLQTQCPSCDTSSTTVEGRSELPTTQGEIVPEPRGRPMERGAVGGFLDTDPLSPSDPQRRAEFEQLSAREQRDQVFELQRRAVIHFVRDRVVQEHREAVAPRDETGDPVRCPEEVIEAARASFGIGIL